MLEKNKIKNKNVSTRCIYLIRRERAPADFFNGNYYNWAKGNYNGLKCANAHSEHRAWSETQNYVKQNFSDRWNYQNYWNYCNDRVKDYNRKIYFNCK